MVCFEYTHFAHIRWEHIRLHVKGLFVWKHITFVPFIVTWRNTTWSYYKLICLPLPAFFLRLLLPYERQIKGEHDKPLPLSKPKKQEGGQEKASGAKSKGVGAKKLKSPNNPKLGSRKDREETVKDHEQSQVSHRLLPAAARSRFLLALNSITFWSPRVFSSVLHPLT